MSCSIPSDGPMVSDASRFWLDELRLGALWLVAPATLGDLGDAGCSSQIQIKFHFIYHSKKFTKHLKSAHHSSQVQPIWKKTKHSTSNIKQHQHQPTSLYHPKLNLGISWNFAKFSPDSPPVACRLARRPHAPLAWCNDSRTLCLFIAYYVWEIDIVSYSNIVSISL